LGETIYVFDAYALLEAESLVPTSLTAAFFNDLSDLVRQGRLRFPEIVWRELHKFAPTSTAGVWAKAIAGEACKDRCPFSWETDVLAICRDLLDPEGEAAAWQPGVKVAALTMFLSSDTHVLMVTGDYKARPDRMCLHDAGPVLRLPAVRTAEFLAAHREDVPSLLT
jgi:hypothetical protein